ncbi:MAG TPA: hypothetical protein VFJ98_06560 [Mycobacteriales bacterium]|nr:hypothetical protein [Mycobacteriales bacterium]
MLRRDGDDYEVVSNGVFLMDTRDGRSERLLVTAALDAVATPGSVLIGGLGVGFSLTAALADDRAESVTVVEIEQRIVDWHATHLRAWSRGGLHDPRVTLVVGDLARHVAGSSAAYDVVCVDVDNGPSWTVTPANDSLYGAEGTRRMLAAVRPGGVLTVWSARAEPAYEQLLRAEGCDVQVLTVEVPRGEPDVIYLARPRAPTSR